MLSGSLYSNFPQPLPPEEQRERLAHFISTREGAVSVYLSNPRVAHKKAAFLARYHENKGLPTKYAKWFNKFEKRTTDSRNPSREIDYLQNEKGDDSPDARYALSFRPFGPTMRLLEDSLEGVADEGTKSWASDVKNAYSQYVKERNYLWQHNMRLAIDPAQKQARVTGRLSAINDFVSEGVRGVRRALELFDFVNDSKFSTYANTWIREYVETECATSRSGVGWPVHVERQIRKYKDIQKEIMGETNREPSNETYMNRLNIGSEALDNLKHAVSLTGSSLDEDNEFGKNDHERISGPDNTFRKMEEQDDSKALTGFLDNFGFEGHEKYILEQLYALGDTEHAKTQGELARELGLQRTTVSLAKIRALKKMRSTTPALELSHLFPEYEKSLSGLGISKEARANKKLAPL